MINIGDERFPSSVCRLYHNELGIHTFELQYQFSLSKEQELLQHVWKNVIMKNPRCLQNRQMVSLMPGLQAQMLNTDVGQFLKLMVNPRILVDGPVGYLRITDGNSGTIRDCKKKFNRYWKEHGLPQISMRSCKLTRVDLCMNIEFGEDFSVVTYLDLLMHTPYKGQFFRQYMQEPEDDRHLYKIANQRRGLVVYDKLYEQRTRYGQQVFDCQNLMRIEYQLKARALGILREREALYGNRSLLQWVADHAEKLLCEGVYEILCADPYVSSEKIRAEIGKNPSWRESTQEELWQLQRDIYQAESYDTYLLPWKSMAEWRELPQEEKKLYRQRKARLYVMLKRYQMLGVCPASLRKRSGLHYLPSLYQLVCAVLREREQQRHAVWGIR